MKKFLMVAVVFCLVMVAGNAFAYRPFLTDSADVVGKGVFIDELGGDFLKWENKDSDTILSSFMFFGITKDLHVGGGVPYGNKTGGFNDIYYYAKYTAIRAEAKNPNYQNYVSYGVATDYAYTKPTHLLFEVSGNKNPDKTLQDQKVVMFGVNYAISDRCIADVNYRKGLTDTSQKYQVGAGLTVIF